MTEPQWRYHTPERDGHAPDDWVEKQPVQYISGGVAWIRAASPQWNAGTKYRYRPLQDATYEPDLLAQCLALPQDQREALIEAMQKPVGDWADGVWEQVLKAGGRDEMVDVIRSMCRPKAVDLDGLWLRSAVTRIVLSYTGISGTSHKAAEELRAIIREALS